MAKAVYWYLLTIAMSICFTITSMLSIIQTKSFKWYSSYKKDGAVWQKKRELFCLYGAYISASICSLQCLLNHVSNYFPSWYCRYFMSVCVIFHEAAKTFGYGFFLERAKSVTKSTKIFILPPVMEKYVLPIYISCYFVLYSILCPLTFQGLAVDPKVSESPTACLFHEYEEWVFYFSVGVEIFNSIFFVWLFAYPLYKIIKPEINTDIIRVIQYNIIFSSIACISSVTFLFYRAFARNSSLGYYLWLAGNIDLVINALCTFMMVTANRKYMKHISRCKHQQNNPTKKKKKKKDDTTNDGLTSCDMTPVENQSLVQMDSFNAWNRWKERDPKYVAGSVVIQEDKEIDTMDDTLSAISLPKLNKSVTNINMSSTFGYNHNKP